MSLSWDEFQNVEMRVGTIVEVSEFPEARIPAYKLKIDFGKDIGFKKTSAQITARYAKVDLLNRQVVAVINFPVKQIANFMSECLVLGAVEDNKEVILLHPGLKVENGCRIS